MRSVQIAMRFGSYTDLVCLIRTSSMPLLMLFFVVISAGFLVSKLVHVR